MVVVITMVAVIMMVAKVTKIASSIVSDDGSSAWYVIMMHALSYQCPV